MRASAVALLFLLAAAGCGAAADEEDRRARVAERGAKVMSFDLARTTHVFRALENGGVQTVVVRNRKDREQIGLVREHMRHEVVRFRRGDFSSPEEIHGEHMPGLHELAMGAERLDIRYEPVPLGGRIWYRTKDPELVRAIHRWFRAQVADHGEHARGEF